MPIIIMYSKKTSQIERHFSLLHFEREMATFITLNANFNSIKTGEAEN